MEKIKKYLLFITMLYTSFAFAEDTDPATRAADKMQTIMFGSLGTSLATIMIGATFVMAKTGKITWDRFIFVGLCTAGFLGAPAIVNIIKSAVTGS